MRENAMEQAAPVSISTQPPAPAGRRPYLTPLLVTHGSVTELTAAGAFYKAEPYHDDYFLNNTNQPYCQFVVAPKVAKFRKLFSGNRKTGAPA